MFRTLKVHLAELRLYHGVLQQLVRQQLILRYRRTTLGFIWTLINPVLMISVTALVFSTLFQMDLKEYTIFLFAGMVPWNCFNSIVIQSSGAFINNEGLIKKIYLPKVIIPLSLAIALLIDSALSFLALFLIILSIGGSFSLALIVLPIAYLLLFIFSFGIALVVSVSTVYFRDLQYVIQILMQAWFFLTPIVYKSEFLAGKVAWAVSLNPVATYIEPFRRIIYVSSFPDTVMVIKAFIFSVVSLAIGYIFFSLKEKKIVFRL